MSEKPKKKRPMRKKAARKPAAEQAAPTTATESSPVEVKTFEESLASLESTVQQLESGELSLSESLESYEAGIKWLRLCYRQLERAEQQVALLTEVNDQGEFTAERFDEAEMSLDEKASARGSRRSVRRTTPEGGKETDGVDGFRGLF